MSGIPTFEDMKHGPKLFEDMFGTTWGPRLWRVFFVVMIVAILTLGLSQIGSTSKEAFEFVRSLFSPEKVSVPSVTANSCPSANRCVTDRQRTTLKRQILPGAVVSIMPLMPGEPEAFSRELGTALSDAKATVSVGGHNMIMNGQEGLLVYFSHSNSVSTSVFAALKEAGLKPNDAGDLPSDQGVFIKVGPAGEN